MGYSTGENHGQTDTRLYKIWIGMKTRCYNENTPVYPMYGGRGIVMCDDWLDSFVAFAEWANANGYEEHLTIDREDVNGCYNPNNCRWINMQDQSNNRRSNIDVTYDGRTQTLKQWCEELNLSYTMVYQRYLQFGIDATRLFEPSRGNGEKYFTHDGKTLSLKQWAKEYNLNYKTFMGRYSRHGFNPKELFKPAQPPRGRHANK